MTTVGRQGTPYEFRFPAGNVLASQRLMRDNLPRHAAVGGNPVEPEMDPAEEKPAVIQEEEHVCAVCTGSGLNDDGTPCAHCGGTGKGT